MKKSSAILFALLGLPGLVSQALAANNGTINFSGTVTSMTCDVRLNGQENESAVLLPPVSQEQLKTASWTAGRTAFELKLNNCQGAMKSAAAYFEAGAGVDSSGRLRNTGSASNVVLQLREGSGSFNPIVAGNPSQIANATYYAIPSTGIVTLPYVVEYYSMGVATAGSVVGNVVYSLQYK